jgi:hypothetical protein
MYIIIHYNMVRYDAYNFNCPLNKTYMSKNITYFSIVGLTCFSDYMETFGMN